MSKKILYTTSEVFPLVKTGGLADVSASLPRALWELGHQVRVLLPGYSQAMANAAPQGMELITRVTVQGRGVTLWESRLPGTPVVLWLVDIPELYQRSGTPYQDEYGNDWDDNAERFQLFSKVAALLAMDQAGLDWRPDLIHCNDWQTALVPALLESEQNRPATVFTVHNLAYQGIFPPETFWRLGLPPRLWRFEGLEFHGQLAFMKGGLAYADRLTTVSPTYAREIQTPAFGQGLDGLLQYRQDVLSGILNGIDSQEWDPSQDRHISAHFCPGQLTGKATCKRELQQSQGLELGASQPLLGFIGRLADQKGMDLIIELLPGLLESGCQVAILGAGAPDLEATLRRHASQYPGRLSVTIGYDEALAHRITAGADIFLMPSRFEPCGLNQMYSLRYGTIPIVHGVGGLRDTVLDPCEASLEEANGFCFHTPTATALWAAVARAVDAYRTNDIWHSLQQNGMARDFSWHHSARAYDALYDLALETRMAG